MQRLTNNFESSRLKKGYQKNSYLQKLENMRMKRILVISFSNLKTDGRVKRQIKFLQTADTKITVICYGGDESLNVDTIKIAPPPLGFLNKLALAGLLLLAKYRTAYPLLYGQKLSLDNNFDLIIANDIETLPLAFQLKNKAKIIFDAHEYSPRHFEDQLYWRVFFQGFNKFLCQEYIPRVDGMITIGSAIADEYEKQYHVRPQIITNATPFYELKPKAASDQKIRLVHQGSANASRKLELMFEMMKLLDDRFYLDLILVHPAHRSGKRYLKKLKSLAKNNNRIAFLPPVSTEQLIPTLNDYDFGLIMIPPTNFNYKNTLPNKFFECIQARVALAIGPIPEMKKITEEYNIGIVSDDFSPISMATLLQSLTVEKINMLKTNTNRAAQEFTAEKNGERLNNLISKIEASA